MRAIPAFLILASLTLSVMWAEAQSPTPVVVQAATPVPTKVVSAPAETSEAAAANLKVLRELKAAN